MKFEKETENKIREVFHKEEFQDFMFETIFGSSKNEDGELYRNVYKYELETAENELIHLIKSHVHHDILVYKNSIVSFVLENIVEKLNGDNLNCNNVDFFGLCGRLYCMIFDIIITYFY